MKIIILTVFCFLSLNSKSQISENEQINISKKGHLDIIFKTSSDIRIDEDVKTIKFLLDSMITMAVRIKFSDSKKKYFLESEMQVYERWFDLKNKADSILFYSNYSYLKNPKYPLIENFSDHWKKDSSLMFYISTIEIGKDSTIYSYTRNYKRNDSVSRAIPVKLQIKKRDLEKNIEDQIKNSLHIDSTIILEAIVSKSWEAKIDSIYLLYGERSKFSDAVEESLLNFAKWKPALIASSGRPIKVKMRIYAKLHKNGNVEIELPKRLYNHTGD